VTTDTLPHRARWHLAFWHNLTRRGRRRLRHHPALCGEQRAWVAAFPARMNRLMKRIYAQQVSEMMPKDSPVNGLMTLLGVSRSEAVDAGDRFIFPTLK
jgi:hypothetical protein